MWFSSVKAYHFNSIKVRLEPDRKGIMQIITVFQFHKGAIRTKQGRCRQTVFIQFQFHKGAIRTSCRGELPSSVPEFQFHKGAIRTGATQHILLWKANFNSIKVRLERKFSLLVMNISLFQFHKGAIRTFNRFRCFVSLRISIP